MSEGLCSCLLPPPPKTYHFFIKWCANTVHGIIVGHIFSTNFPCGFANLTLLDTKSVVARQIAIQSTLSEPQVIYPYEKRNYCSKHSRSYILMKRMRTARVIVLLRKLLISFWVRPIFNANWVSCRNSDKNVIRVIMFTISLSISETFLVVKGRWT
jgi:hypothetical protein